VCVCVCVCVFSRAFPAVVIHSINALLVALVWFALEWDPIRRVWHCPLCAVVEEGKAAH
jgi:hypothetical protein